MQTMSTTITDICSAVRCEYTRVRPRRDLEVYLRMARIYQHDRIQPGIVLQLVGAQMRIEADTPAPAKFEVPARVVDRVGDYEAKRAATLRATEWFADANANRQLSTDQLDDGDCLNVPRMQRPVRRTRVQLNAGERIVLVFVGAWALLTLAAIAWLNHVTH